MNDSWEAYSASEEEDNVKKIIKTEPSPHSTYSSYSKNDYYSKKGSQNTHNSYKANNNYITKQNTNYNNSNTSTPNNFSKYKNSNNELNKDYKDYNQYDNYYYKDKKYKSPKKKPSFKNKHFETTMITRPIVSVFEKQENITNNVTNSTNTETNQNTTTNTNTNTTTNTNNLTGNSNKDDEQNNISNININFNFNQQNKIIQLDENKKLENEDKLLKLQNKLITTSIVQNGLKAFFQKLKINKNVKEIETNTNLSNNSLSNISPNPSPNNISDYSVKKKSFTDLKIINSEIFEKLHIKTEKIFQEELKKCFNIMRMNSKDAGLAGMRVSSGNGNESDEVVNNKFQLCIENKLNIEYTEFFNKVEEKTDDNLSIATVSFSLNPVKVKKDDNEYERNFNINLNTSNSQDVYYPQKLTNYQNSQSNNNPNNQSQYYSSNNIGNNMMGSYQNYNSYMFNNQNNQNLNGNRQRSYSGMSMPGMQSGIQGIQGMPVMQGMQVGMQGIQGQGIQHTCSCSMHNCHNLLNAYMYINQLGQLSQGHMNLNNTTNNNNENIEQYYNNNNTTTNKFD